MGRIIRLAAPSPVLRPGAALPVSQAAALILALVLGQTVGSMAWTVLPFVVTAVFLLGGLPHGAFDIHRVAARARLGRQRLIAFLAIYVGIVTVALIGWSIAPEILLPLFLITAIVHFSEDWPEIDEPIFRVALGFAPICAIGAGHPETVEPIFAAMAGPRTAIGVTNALIVFAPVTLLVGAVGLAVSARTLSWHRPALFAALIGAMFVLPPLIGFALFFCAFHTPRHMLAVADDLPRWNRARLIRVGAAISALALALGLIFLPNAIDGGVATVAAGFQLLAALAMPHQSIGVIERMLQRRRRPLD